MSPARMRAIDTTDPVESDASSAELIQWIDRMRAGDDEALGAIFRTTYGELCAYARTFVQSPAAAEDVVEDMFLKLWIDRAAIQVRTSVKSYLYAAVRNRALNHLKRQQLEARYVDPLPDEPEQLTQGAVSDTEDRVNTAEMLAIVRAAIESLPPRTKQAFTLYSQHDMRYADVARVMGISVRTVEHQIAKALRTISSRVEDAT